MCRQRLHRPGAWCQHCSGAIQLYEASQQMRLPLKAALMPALAGPCSSVISHMRKDTPAEATSILRQPGQGECYPVCDRCSEEDFLCEFGGQQSITYMLRSASTCSTKLCKHISLTITGGVLN